MILIYLIYFEHLPVPTATFRHFHILQEDSHPAGESECRHQCLRKSCRMGGSGTSAVPGRRSGCHRDVFGRHFGLRESGGMARGQCPAAAAAGGGAAAGCFLRNTGLGGDRDVMKMALHGESEEKQVDLG